MMTMRETAVAPISNDAPGRTVAERIAITNGRATGFDYLRIFLALSVVIWHSAITSYGGSAQHAISASLLRPIGAFILPMFFALSGFLVAGSLERTPALSKFLGLRFLRIFPALIVETLLSAFILGPIFTKLPIAEYFKNRLFLKYLLNVLGDPHFFLPGVFDQNPFPAVNGQLWTVPFELQCYIVLVALAVFGIAQRRKALLWCTIAMQIAIFVHRALAIRHFPADLFQYTGPLKGDLLVMTFLSGVCLYSNKSAIAYNKYLFMVSGLLLFVLLDVPLGDYFLAFPAAYFTVYIGLLNPRANLIHKLGDLSYGIFLYGFPLQQVVMSWGGWTHHWYINLIFAIPMVTAFAWLSWNVIEKRALSMRDQLVILKPIDCVIDRMRRSVARAALAFERVLSLRRTVKPQRTGP